MKVSKSWLNELIDLKVSMQEVERLLPLRTIATKEINDQFIELDMKGYNRADLLSMRGVAYEISAITDSPVKFEESDETKYIWVDKKLPTLNVKVENEDLNPVYCLAKIEGLKVGPSKDEWVKKLYESGMRSVNNIADVTNLIMLEYGQPLHSFDASQVKEETIIVRTAKQGEEVVTLDNKTRKLETSDLLITDPEKALGIAGVMGGKNSEVTDSTTTILLEAAIFDPVNLRKTTNRLNLPSEASKRFYHGLTCKRLMQALNAAIKMYEELGGKLTALTLTGDLEDQSTKSTIRLSKSNQLIGVDLEAEQVEDYLKKLRFELSDKIETDSDTSWVITPPYFRLDIEIEEDLIEEIARMYGYENISGKELPGQFPEKIDQSQFEMLTKLRQSLVDLGLTEIQTYSFFSTEVLSATGWENGKLKQSENPENPIQLIKIANPISAETEYMRNNIWPNLLEKVVENLKHFDDVAIFEIGNVYHIVDGKPVQKLHLSVALSNGSENPIQELNQILGKIGINPSTPSPDHITPQTFHPTRHYPVEHNGKKTGGATEIHPRVINQLGCEKRIAIAEINLENLS